MEYQGLDADVHKDMMQGVDPRVADYVAQNYMPIYDGKDRGKFGLFNAHSHEHIDWATRRSMHMAKEYNKAQGPDGWLLGKHLDLNMMYVIARLHDIGFFIDSGVEEVDATRHHEKIAARIVADDPGLRQFFFEDEMAIITKAIYDHKQRDNGDPESMYGKILFTADRRFRAMEAIRNSYMFTKSRNPDWTFDQLVNDVHSYLSKNFGDPNSPEREHGYVDDPEYDNDLQVLLDILKDRNTLVGAIREIQVEAEEQSHLWDKTRAEKAANPNRVVIK